jgi:hypothetical protein
MLLWQIHHFRSAFFDADKYEAATKITGMYETCLPRFGLSLLFHEIKKVLLA